MKNIQIYDNTFSHSFKRIVWFDGEIPHSVKPQLHIGPNYRFTISVFFDTNFMEV